MVTTRWRHYGVAKSHNGGNVTEMAYYGACTAVSALVFLVAGLWYVLPRLSRMPLASALVPLLLVSAFRVNGLFFLVPGVASPDLAAGFAVPTAYGDATAAFLALVAAVALRRGSRAGIALVWLYNIVGSLDLVNAIIQVAIHDVRPADFGATWMLPVINVPALVVVHLLIFRLLTANRAPA